MNKFFLLANVLILNIYAQDLISHYAGRYETIVTGGINAQLLALHEVNNGLRANKPEVFYGAAQFLSGDPTSIMSHSRDRTKVLDIMGDRLPVIQGDEDNRFTNASSFAVGLRCLVAGDRMEPNVRDEIRRRYLAYRKMQILRTLYDSEARNAEDLTKTIFMAGFGTAGCIVGGFIGTLFFNPLAGALIGGSIGAYAMGNEQSLPVTRTFAANSEKVFERLHVLHRHLLSKVESDNSGFLQSPLTVLESADNAGDKKATALLVELHEQDFYVQQDAGKLRCYRSKLGS